MNTELIKKAAEKEFPIVPKNDYETKGINYGYDTYEDYKYHEKDLKEENFIKGAEWALSQSPAPVVDENKIKSLIDAVRNQESESMLYGRILEMINLYAKKNGYALPVEEVKSAEEVWNSIWQSMKQEEGSKANERVVIKAMEQYALQFKGNAPVWQMKWVKATDRLPLDYKPDELLIIRLQMAVKKVPWICTFNKIENKFVFEDLEDRGEEDFHNIEWLYQPKLNRNNL